MDVVFDPYLGKMVDRRTGLPVAMPPGHVPPQRVNALDQMFNGTGIPERMNALHSLFNPVVALGEAGQHSQNMLAPGRAPTERISDMGKMLTGMAGTVAPMWAASRGAVPATNAMVDALTGINLGNPADFMADEFGGMKAPFADRSITAYHGSPHSFDKFSMDKIGTGEGAQAYGHGLYFAENEGVARGYRDALSGSTGNAQHTMLRKVMMGTTPDRVLPAMQRIYPGITAEDIARLTKEMEAVPSPGSMYEVRINANPDDFLDWDKPLSEQPAKVRKALGPRVEALRQAGAGLPEDPIGEALWGVAHPQGGFDKTDFSRSVPEQATERLHEAGIPGIKYLDAGSRGAGDGSRNYVVFDENLIEIVKKYGIAGAAAMLGVTAADVEQAMAGQK